MTTRAPRETVLANAVDLARAAAEEVALPGQVGEHRGVVVEADRLLTHVFDALVPGYRGWHWAVTVARPPRGRTATVCEVQLLPGEGALLAPEWVPWSERLRPGDVGPGDVLPYVEDDERLEQGYEATGEDADQLALYELGLGRARVLSPEGRAQALTRWYEGDRGPFAPSAKAAAAPCSTCGFFMKLAGSPRTVFGVCANEWSPDDGRVVSMDHGCGAHSETRGPEPASLWQPSEPVVDERDMEVLATAPVAPAAKAADGGATAPADNQPDAGDQVSRGTPAPAENQPDAEDQARAENQPDVEDQAPADVTAEIAGEQETESAADGVADADAVAGPGAATGTAEDGSADRA
ncbi:DUF3027 domain-containing protein [Georgenia sp. SUBG003]|uniref:DUF3027 domain-containing protein n=1 Tax=Georgenia sp. SUBG003 TaxID=1497974 RepID=UPI000AA037D1